MNPGALISSQNTAGVPRATRHTTLGALRIQREDVGRRASCEDDLRGTAGEEGRVGALEGSRETLINCMVDRVEQYGRPFWAQQFDKGKIKQLLQEAHETHVVPFNEEVAGSLQAFPSRR